MTEAFFFQIVSSISDFNLDDMHLKSTSILLLRDYKMKLQVREKMRFFLKCIWLKTVNRILSSKPKDLPIASSQSPLGRPWFDKVHVDSFTHPRLVAAVESRLS